ncbi:manganese transporter permease [Sphingomonas sp. Leaf231]|uniref:UbiA family prenyltransferase n=1 Tax=Sphingomonas sp. Leaf231 TaxID=1736301 RepID=UPI0006F3F3B6|nr:UbiA family prenyltransferase [Sphingomonas sp. Leaf231]KQN90115.1 manganese transporter permease [Sphingomonas sp. Leaf231]
MIALPARDPVLARLAIYQRERFPLARTALLVAVFSSASVSASAHLAGRAVPSPATYLAAFVVTLCFFFQLRVLDEIKDAEDDRRYRPERPIPRGLVSLRLIVGLGIATVPLAILACVAIDPWLLGALALAWGWMALMTAEFFVPAWLKARPAAYTMSHMLVMPLIDLVLTGFEWVPQGGAAPALALFLLMSFANGCVLEIGRKLWAPENERTGVETYSALLGPARAGTLWIGCVLLALGLLGLVGIATGAPIATAVIGAVAAVAVVRVALRYRRAPTPAGQRAIDGAAGLWVFACYVAAGFAPMVGW